MDPANSAAREMPFRIVYCGPSGSGKVTNLQVIHRRTPPTSRSDIVSLPTETGRTVFFDILPTGIHTIRGLAVKFELYSAPGHADCNATRKRLLRGVDGVVFVADSSRARLQQDLESFQDLLCNLAEYGDKREDVPTVLQYNKRDLPDAMSVEELDRLVNKYHLPWNEAVASKGLGVLQSLRLIGRLITEGTGPFGREVT